jgi:hypothetical protein
MSFFIRQRAYKLLKLLSIVFCFCVILTAGAVSKGRGAVSALKIKVGKHQTDNFQKVTTLTKGKPVKYRYTISLHFFTRVVFLVLLSLPIYFLGVQ